MHLLCVLAREPGRIVSRADLIEEVWQASHVTDDAVSAAVYQLRRAFGDQPRTPRYLETVPKRGYRWLLPVDEVPAMPLASPSEATTARERRWVWATGAFLGGAIFIAVFLNTASDPAGAPMPQGPREAPPASVDGPAASRSPESRSSPAFADFRSAYVRGWYLLNQRDPMKLATAFEEFRQAIEIAPGDAGAHAGLASAYCIQADLGVAEIADAREGATRSLRRAWDIQSDRAEVLYARGLSRLIFDRNIPAATADLRAAIEADRTNPVFHIILAWAHAASGRRAKAVFSARRAVELDPTALTNYLDLARLLAYDHRLEESASVLDRALALEPMSAPAAAVQAWVLAHLGQDRASYRRFRRALTLRDTPARELAAYDAAWRASGLMGTLAYRADVARERAAAGAGSWLSSALLRARTGDGEGAIIDLERAVRAGDRAVPYVLDSPDFNGLRDDPRFTRIGRDVRPRP